MKFSKVFYITATITSLLVGGIAYADTCYDPNYNRYYNCSGDEYIAPVVAAALFGAILSNNDDGDRNYGGHHRRGHGHGGNRKHH